MKAVQIEGDQLCMRPWLEADLDALALLRNDVVLQAQLMARVQPNSLERVRKWLLDRERRDDMLLFVAAARTSNEALGYLQIASIDTFHGIGELGICFPPQVHGCGLATEACNLVDIYLANELGLRKIILRVLADNARAIGFYHKCGYREVGRLKSHHRAGAELIDVVLMERFLAR